jgi:glucan phosphoethanolaminetransferase (alkaline phosphatase superfamily)
MMLLWGFLALAAAIVCIVRATQDWKQDRRKWALLMIAVAVVIVTCPIPVTHKISIDLPADWMP